MMNSYSGPKQPDEIQMTMNEVIETFVVGGDIKELANRLEAVEVTIDSTHEHIFDLLDDGDESSGESTAKAQIERLLDELIDLLDFEAETEESD